MEGTPVEIVSLLTSPVHAFEGRPSDGPRPDPGPVSRSCVEVRAGLGLVGDRYFNHAAHRDAAVTVFDAAALDQFGSVDPLLTRRNIVLRGFRVDDLAATRDRPGALFVLDSGDGPIRFQGRRPANPCAWMDVSVGPGAFRGLRGRGGVRCIPLDDGVLRVGPARLTVVEVAVEAR